ncbi:MAG TPA: inositol monophosphatase [Anaerolineae bacterium]|nr:inositol monophosphatase [Anaerolineae bacterium]
MCDPISPDDLEARLDFAIEQAQRAGELLREGQGCAQEVNHKGAIDLITEYDLRSEELLVEAIHETCPGDAILAEEEGELGEGEARWLIDPLDGTTNFAHGLPIFSVSIAWAVDLRPLVGVVYDPMRDELFHALRGGGAWLNGRRLRVSQERELENSLLVTGFPYDRRTNPENNLDHFAAFALRTRGVRRLGAASLDLANVAAGRFDGYWEVRLWPWDWAAGMLLVEEAGGRISRTDGGTDVFAQPTSMLASNGLIHEAMVRVLSGKEA